MNFGINNEFTLLSGDKTYESRQIDGGKCAVSDFAILLGAQVSDNYHVDYDNSLKGRTSWWYLSSNANYFAVDGIHENGASTWIPASRRSGGVRPVLPYSNISDIPSNGVRGISGFLEIEYGEYPQYAVDPSLGSILDIEFSTGKLRKTGKTYTTDSSYVYSEKFSPVEHKEFEYNGKRYVRVKSNCYEDGYKLSNGVEVRLGDYVWVEVSPITWYVDESSSMLVSKTLLASGIRFCNDGQYFGNFKTTEMYMFLNKCFAKDIVVHKMKPKEKAQHEERKQAEKRRNSYELKFNRVSEEEIIKGVIESETKGKSR